MAIIPTKITITEATLPLIQDAATEKGQTLEVYLGDQLGNGQSIQGIANDRAWQAYNRLAQAGNTPAEVLAESRRAAEASAPKVAA